MKKYTFSQLSKRAKEHAIKMFNKYNNPKKKDAVQCLSASIWQFRNDGSLFNGLN